MYIVQWCTLYSGGHCTVVYIVHRKTVQCSLQCTVHHSQLSSYLGIVEVVPLATGGLLGEAGVVPAGHAAVVAHGAVQLERFPSCSVACSVECRVSRRVSGFKQHSTVHAALRHSDVWLSYGPESMRTSIHEKIMIYDF